MSGRTGYQPTLITIALVGLSWCSLSSAVEQRLNDVPNPARLTLESILNLSQHKQIPNQLQNHQLDAPKYYDLNALLYKSKAGGQHDNQVNHGTDSRLAGPLNSEADLKPARRMGPLNGDSRPIDDDEDSTFDGLVRSMRRYKESSSRNNVDETDLATTSKRSSLDRASVSDHVEPSEEAITQRKSNNFADDPEQADSSARLRNRGKLKIY